MASRDIYIAKENAMINTDTNPVRISKGVTRVRAGHELLDLYPDLFEPITVQYEVAEDTSSRTRDTGRADARKTAEPDPKAEAKPDPKPAEKPAEKPAAKTAEAHKTAAPAAKKATAK
jgi:hypothetical protein